MADHLEIAWSASAILIVIGFLNPSLGKTDNLTVYPALISVLSTSTNDSSANGVPVTIFIVINVNLALLAANVNYLLVVIVNKSALTH